MANSLESPTVCMVQDGELLDDPVGHPLRLHGRPFVAPAPAADIPPHPQQGHTNTTGMYRTVFYSYS